MLIQWLLLITLTISGFRQPRTTTGSNLDTTKRRWGDEQSEVEGLTSLNPMTVQNPGLHPETAVSICLLLIVRDEEDNLRENLPFWRDIASCYVIGVDDRTTDGTMQVIRQTLPEDKPS